MTDNSREVEEVLAKKLHALETDWFDGCYIRGEDVDAICDYVHHQLQKVRESERWRIWGELCDIAEPDERQFGAGDLNTHLDDVHKIIFTKDSVTVEEKIPPPEYVPWKDSFNALTIRKSSNHSELDQSTDPDRKPICKECMKGIEHGKVVYTAGHCPKHPELNQDKK